MERFVACAVQMAHGNRFEENLAHAHDLLIRAAAQGTRLALLPEYWFHAQGHDPLEAAERELDVRAFLADASRDLDLVVAGNLLARRGEGTLNLGVAYERGRLALEQPKVHPMPREAAAGIVAGSRFGAARVAGRPTGMLVCADVLYPEAAQVLSLQGARVLLNPVMSPWRESDATRQARDALFVARAYDAGAFVLKAGGCHRPDGSAPVPGGPPRAIAGRSLVTAPWGILARYADEFAEELVFAHLDFAMLDEFRAHKTGFPPRQPEAYRDLLGGFTA